MGNQRSKKRVSEKLLKISMVQLRKNGFLKPGENTGGVACPDGTVRVKLATTIAGPDGDYLNLRYTSSSGVHYDAWIPISTTLSRVGGLRCYFMCPKCDPTRRVTVLFFDGERFVCRLCCDLTYMSKKNPFADASIMDFFDAPPYLSYKGKPTRRAKRLARRLKKAKVLADRFDKLKKRQDKRLEKLKVDFEKKIARITKKQGLHPPNQ